MRKLKIAAQFSFDEMDPPGNIRLHTRASVLVLGQCTLIHSLYLSAKPGAGGANNADERLLLDAAGRLQHLRGDLSLISPYAATDLIGLNLVAPALSNLEHFNVGVYATLNDPVPSLPRSNIRDFMMTTPGMPQAHLKAVLASLAPASERLSVMLANDFGGSCSSLFESDFLTQTFLPYLSPRRHLHLALGNPRLLGAIPRTNLRVPHGVGYLFTQDEPPACVVSLWWCGAAHLVAEALELYSKHGLLGQGRGLVIQAKRGQDWTDDEVRTLQRAAMALGVTLNMT